MARAGKTTSGPSAERVRRRLLDWYGRSRRDLPWRRVRDPYAIWVSEVMLQQTRVATVIPYYERFLARFPTLTALARAEESEVLAAWQGLGYYRRARALHRGARAVAADHGGSLPRDLEGLRAIPGIGPYTAGAIASIAFDTPAPVVDGNVTRVLCRLYALGGDPAKNPLRAELWRRAAQLVPAARASDFNQALMELGATVCTPRAPRCDECPLRRACLARSHGSAEALPEKKRRLPTVAVRASAGVVLGCSCSSWPKTRRAGRACGPCPRSSSAPASRPNRARHVR
jgi:A/G-specific adenine glycosylase